jgi:intracellular multiplication protein IcmK
LDPATEPLTFKLATGHVTTVNFLDVSGQPWPIKDVTWAGNFEVKSSTQGGDGQFPMFPNLLRIIPLSEYAYGNMSIRMYGLATPLTFTLRTNKDVVQYRLDLRIPEIGPLAQPSIIQNDRNDLAAGDAILTRIMEGIPPATAEKVSLNGIDARTSAYRLDGTLYVRTPLTLLSPAWTGSVRSADGMNVYALLSAPVLLLSDQGQMVRATIQETAGTN